MTLHEKFKADPDIMFEKCDVTNKESVESMVGAVVKKYGKIDAIINNAGVSRPQMLVDYYGEKPQYEVNEAIFDFVVNVNQKGVLLCAQAAARQMIKQKSGVIINMSSEAGVNGSTGQSIYNNPIIFNKNKKSINKLEYYSKMVHIHIISSQWER